MKTLTKEEAIKAMREIGVKISHTLFLPEEYIYSIREGTISTEDGMIHDENDFWKFRQGDVWETGWFII